MISFLTENMKLGSPYRVRKELLDITRELFLFGGNMSDITVPKGLFEGLCGLLEVSLYVEGFEFGIPDTVPGTEYDPDITHYYLNHSLDHRLRIKVPCLRIVEDEEYTKANDGKSYVLKAEGVTEVSYDGVVLARLEGIRLGRCHHRELWSFYDTILKWYKTKKIPSYMDGTKKEQWASFGEMTGDDPNFRIGELVYSGSPIITETFSKHFPRESKRALKYYLEYKDK